MLKVTELFYSLQGESLYTGTPSIFLRLFGCNFKCAGFGMKRGELSTEYTKINPDDYKSIDDLPLVDTGCDSYISWDPRFKKFSKNMSVEDIVEYTRSILKQNFNQNIHFIITGGEPLLGQSRQIELAKLLKMLYDTMNLKHVTFETNGTQKLNSEFSEYVNINMPDLEIFFSISAKLPVSGEKFEDAIKPESVMTYKNVKNMSMAFKFVVDSQEDFNDMQRALNKYSSCFDLPPVYVMPIGGTSILYDNNKKIVADLCLENGYRYSQRLQLDLYGNGWAT